MPQGYSKISDAKTECQTPNPHSAPKKTAISFALVGYAGSLKSKEMSEEEKKVAIKEFALKKGIFIAIFAGVMSACFNFGFESAKPIEDVALRSGLILFPEKPFTDIFIDWRIYY